MFDSLADRIREDEQETASANVYSLGCNPGNFRCSFRRPLPGRPVP